MDLLRGVGGFLAQGVMDLAECLRPAPLVVLALIFIVFYAVVSSDRGSASNASHVLGTDSGDDAASSGLHGDGVEVSKTYSNQPKDDIELGALSGIYKY